MNNTTSPRLRRTPATRLTPLRFIALLLAGAAAGASSAFASDPSTGADSQSDSPGTLISKSASDSGQVRKCLVVAADGNALALDRCDIAGKGQWQVSSSAHGMMLQEVGELSPRRCLVNIGWEAKVADCEASKAEHAWQVRDGQPGFVRLQNAYSSEERCLAVKAGQVSLDKCAEQLEVGQLWSESVVPRGPTFEQRQLERFPQSRRLVLSPLPDAHAEQQRLKQRLKWSDWQPTGFYLNHSTPLDVQVSDLPPAATLQLAVGVNSLVQPWQPSSCERNVSVSTLGSGANSVYRPTQGGLIFMRFLAPHSDARVTVELGQAAQPVPYFTKDIAQSAWTSMLSASTIPYALLASDRVIIASSLASAKSVIGESRPALLLQFYQMGIEAQNAFAGLDGQLPPNPVSPLRPFVVETCAGSNPNAWDYSANMPYPAVEALSALRTLTSWGLWHELGHQRQNTAWTWDWPSLSEVTVNLYTTAALRRFWGENLPVGPRPAAWDRAQIYLMQPDAEREFDNMESNTGANREVMFEQLRRAFGDTFYPRLEQAARALDNPGDGATRKRWFQVQASKAANVDLSAYFTAWGLRPDAKTLAQIAALKLPTPPGQPTQMPVFGGSAESRVLDVWAFSAQGNNVQIEGHAWPPGAVLEAHSQERGWLGVATADAFGRYRNDALDKGYLRDGATTLELRTANSAGASQQALVGERPVVTSLRVQRTQSGAIRVRGTGAPAGANIEAHTRDGSWPAVATVGGNGTFENDHLNDNHLVDGSRTLEVRMNYRERIFPERWRAVLTPAADGSFDVECTFATPDPAGQSLKPVQGLCEKATHL